MLGISNKPGYCKHIKLDAGDNSKWLRNRSKNGSENFQSLNYVTIIL